MWHRQAPGFAAGEGGKWPSPWSGANVSHTTLAGFVGFSRFARNCRAHRRHAVPNEHRRRFAEDRSIAQFPQQLARTVRNEGLQFRGNEQADGDELIEEPRESLAGDCVAIGSLPGRHPGLFHVDQLVRARDHRQHGLHRAATVGAVQVAVHQQGQLAGGSVEFPPDPAPYCPPPPPAAPPAPELPDQSDVRIQGIAGNASARRRPGGAAAHREGRRAGQESETEGSPDGDPASRIASASRMASSINV